MNQTYKAQLERELKDASLTIGWCMQQEAWLQEKRQEAESTYEQKQNELNALEHAEPRL